MCQLLRLAALHRGVRSTPHERTACSWVARPNRPGTHFIPRVARPRRDGGLPKADDAGLVATINGEVLSPIAPISPQPPHAARYVADGARARAVVACAACALRARGRGDNRSMVPVPRSSGKNCGGDRSRWRPALYPELPERCRSRRGFEPLDLRIPSRRKRDHSRRLAAYPRACRRTILMRGSAR